MLSKVRGTGIILAGGKSTRMGRDKSLLSLGNETMLERICLFSTSFFTDTLIVLENKEKVTSLNLNGAYVVEDYIHNCGPLGGIYSGLSESENHLNVVFTCDMPFVKEALIYALLYAWEEHLDVICFEGIKSKYQPFPGIFKRDTRFLIRTLIDQKEYSLRKFLDVSIVKCLEIKNDLMCYHNINHPNEYTQAINEFKELLSL